MSRRTAQSSEVEVTYGPRPPDAKRRGELGVLAEIYERAIQRYKEAGLYT